jgi:hypothetical protein
MWSFKEGRGRQEDHEFRASLEYIARPCLVNNKKKSYCI